MILVDQLASQLFSQFFDETFPDIFIEHLCFDSREVKSKSAFLALGSVAGNRDEYINAALNADAAIVLFDPAEGDGIEDNRCFAVKNLKQKTGDLLHEWFGRVTETLSVIGITGTNGKSSISFYIAQLLEALKKNCAVMGTLGYGKPDQLTEMGMTTLPLEKLHSAMAELSSHYEAVAMEVSSHGLHQNRLAGLHFTGAVYTNLSHDHLDYHGTMDDYAEAKALLFKKPGLSFAVINGDDHYAHVMGKNCSAKQVIYYGQKNENDLWFSIKQISDSGLLLNIAFKGDTAEMHVPLFGSFNAYNSIAALCVVLQMGISFHTAVKTLSELKSVAGRMQRIGDHIHHPLVLVDYAHTPDALEQALSTSQRHCQGKLTVVVGCGGDRDVSKRPLMGEIAARYADKVIITSDNPRSESPAVIAEQMVVNLAPDQYQIELDREQAIRQAILLAEKGDLVLVAGKGHEEYQETNGQRRYFSDVAVAKEVLGELS